MRRVSEIIDLIAGDRERGSMELAQLVVDAFEALAEEGHGVREAVSLARRIISSRPTMMPVCNTACMIAHKSVTSLEKAVREVREELSSSSVNSSARAASLIPEGSVVATLSYSSTVLRCLVRARERIESVYVFESRPLGEGARLASKLSENGLRARVVPDSSYAHVSSLSDLLLLGCDAILPEGYLVNKIGSLPAALSFRESGKRVVVVAENIKVAPLRVREARPRAVEEEGGVPLFESVPLRLVDDLVTEDGVLGWADVIALSHRHRSAWEFVKKFSS